MRIAFFGLAFHERTGSSRFLLDLLRSHAEVAAWHAEPDIAAVRRHCAGFDEARFDAIVIFQLHEAFILLSGRHPNVTFVPMYDAMFRGGAFTWRPSFSAAKVLCFSWALRQQVMRHAPVHAQVQYFPDPAARPQVADFASLRGFLWYRRRQIAPEQVFAMTAGTRFAELTIHDAPDPGHAAPGGWQAPAHVGTLRRTEWSAEGSAFAAALAAANVFFAPRPAEGIGMGFLEAMAGGLCVVAPDAPTMNEVISHGTNGLLYPPGSQAPLDFSRARELGARARQDVVRGRARWEAGLPALMEFIATPFATLRARGPSHAVALPPGPACAGTIAVLAPGADAATLADLAQQQGCTVTALAPPAGTALAGSAADWVLVLPAGARLRGPHALCRLLAGAPAAAEIILGHHLLRQADGAEQLCRAAAPGAAWQRLLRGEVTPAAMPAPAATLLRRGLLLRLGAEPPQSPATLAALLLRAEAEDIAVHVCDEVVARCGPAPAEAAQWLELVRQQAGATAAAGYEAAQAAAAQARAAQHRASRPARLALGLVAALDRVAPRLGWAAERLVLGDGVRRMRAWLGSARRQGAA